MADNEKTFFENYKDDMKETFDNGGTIASRLTFLGLGWIAGASVGFNVGSNGLKTARVAAGPLVLIP